MSLLRHIQACHDADISLFLPFYLAGNQVGAVHPSCVAELRKFLPEMTVIQDGYGIAEENFDARNRIFAEFGKKLVAHGKIRRLKGENFPILPYLSTKTTAVHSDADFAHPLALIDRKIVPFLGVQGFGIHLNGIYRNPRQDITHLWIARRSLDRAIAPGKLDNMVAGGQGAYFTPLETLIKEADEEAGLPKALIADAKAVGQISYTKKWELPGWGTGLRHDCLFIYDLEIPSTITPQNKDGEIAEFFLMGLAEIAESLDSRDDFKFNVTLVQIDFLLRHGFMTQSHPEYLDISRFFTIS
ncbi:MAG: NUDIX domain-containing protein [Alphaproteobacteria bacterium]|nr:NUDIX domain-containing protein [Alphaproteobacteria bacterium]